MDWRKKAGGGMMELTIKDLEEISNINTGQFVMTRENKYVVPVSYLAKVIVAQQQRIAELEQLLSLVDKEIRDRAIIVRSMLPKESDDEKYLDCTICGRTTHVNDMYSCDACSEKCQTTATMLSTIRNQAQFIVTCESIEAARVAAKLILRGLP